MVQYIILGGRETRDGLGTLVEQWGWSLTQIHNEVQAKVSKMSTVYEDTPLNQHMMSNWQIEMATSNVQPQICLWSRLQMNYISLHCDGLVIAIRASYGGLIET